MRQDAEKDGVPRWASAKDNRVTRVGRFIRATRIDEIPQIINVLEGDMSFIGPRPERPYFVQQLRREMPYYDLRHRVKPGITGWAQVNYRYGESIEDARQKLAFDLYYVKNNDFFLDLTILVQTVRVFCSRTARNRRVAGDVDDADGRAGKAEPATGLGRACRGVAGT